MFVCRNTQKKNRAPRWLSLTEIPLLARVFFQVERLQGERTKRSLPLSLAGCMEGENSPRVPSLSLSFCLARASPASGSPSILSLFGDFSAAEARRDHISSSLHNSTRLFALCRRKTTSSFGRATTLWLTAGDSIALLRARPNLFNTRPTCRLEFVCNSQKGCFIRLFPVSLHYTRPHCHYGKFIILPPVWIVGLTNGKRQWKFASSANAFLCGEFLLINIVESKSMCSIRWKRSILYQLQCVWSS